MQTLITWIENVKMGSISIMASAFFQKCANRLCVGLIRYGAPHTSQNYMTRLTKELKAYKQTGNSEHLCNIANYAFLESICPEHDAQVHGSSRQSATRAMRDNQI